LRWVERNPDRARFLLEGRTIRRSVSGELKEMNRTFRAAIEDWVEDQPTIRSLPWEVFYGTTIGPAQEVARLWLAGRVQSLRRLEDELAGAAWRAVRED
jgi:ABC-type branched-subunit amino acid transport system permease subunit